MKKYRIVFPLLLSCIVWYSCTDWLDYKPSDKQSEEQQFSSKDGFYAAVNGVYNRMSGNSLYGKYLSYDMIDILELSLIARLLPTVIKSSRMKVIIINTCGP